MSDTSFTKTVEDYSLDEDEEVGETSALLLANARKSVNLPETVNAPKRAAPRQLLQFQIQRRREGMVELRVTRYLPSLFLCQLPE